MGMEGWYMTEWDGEETRSWQTGGFSAAIRITRLMARLRAVRLSDDHIKGNSVNTFLCTNGKTGSIKIKFTWRGWIANLTGHSHQPAWTHLRWLHLIFPTKNTASSLAHNTTIVLKSTAGTVKR